METYSEEGKGVRPDLSRKKFALNPQRLLSSHARSPGVLVELARTGQHPQGMPRWTIQGFSDAKLTADGRVLFDANFLEDGKRGWVFLGDANGIIRPLHANLFARQSGFGQLAPRARFLDVNEAGTLAFLDRTQRVQISSLAEERFQKSPKQLVVEDETGVRVGVVKVLHQVRLAKDNWLLMAGDVVEGEKQTGYLLKANQKSLGEGKAFVVVKGAYLPTSRRDPLWMLP